MSGSNAITVTNGTESGSVDNMFTAKSEEHDFNIKTRRTDLTLVVEEKLLYVGKLVLELVSPVFQAMFNGKYKEKDAEELPLPGKRYADVLEFLQCIYPNILKPVTLENVFAVLPLADEYQVSKLKADCESCLLKCLSKNISTVQLYDIMTKARCFNLPRVYERGMNIAADEHYTELDNVENKLSDDLKSDIRVRMLHNLDTKYKNTSRQINTAGALCRFLGRKAKEEELSKVYIEGRLVGDWGSLRVRLRNDGTPINLNLDDISFTVKTKFESDYNVLIECNDLDKCNLKCTGVVVVNNWMKGKRDIMKSGKCQFNSSNHINNLDIMIELYKIEDEKAGFVYEENLTIDVFLFAAREA